jgi:hypothetical protein
MTVIKDGSGQGYLAKVTSENKLTTQAITEDIAAHVNKIEEQVYSVIVSQTPTGAGDCFCYVKNSSALDLTLRSITLAVASDETIQVKIRDIGTPAGGTTYTPVNRNSGSTSTASGIFQTGNDITGIYSGSVVDQFFLKGGNSSKKYFWQSHIIIRPNDTLTFYAVTGAIAIKMSFTIYYHENNT